MEDRDLGGPRLASRRVSPVSVNMTRGNWDTYLRDPRFLRYLSPDQPVRSVVLVPTITYAGTLVWHDNHPRRAAHLRAEVQRPVV